MIRKLVRNTLLFAAIGLTVGFLAPSIGLFIGNSVLGLGIASEAAAMVPVLSAATFGTFGAMNTLLEPIFDKIFGKDHGIRPDHVDTKKSVPAVDVSPSISVSQPALASHAPASFADRVEAQRAQTELANEVLAHR